MIQSEHLQRQAENFIIAAQKLDYKYKFIERLKKNQEDSLYVCA